MNYAGISTIDIVVCEQMLYKEIQKQPGRLIWHWNWDQKLVKICKRPCRGVYYNRLRS